MCDFDYLIFSMLTTKYYKNIVVIKRPYIRAEWVEQVLKKPEKVESVPKRNRKYFWAFVEELGKHLRVVTLSDGKTLHNAFPEKDTFIKDKLSEI